ncbi:MAG: SDR family NAD(P)-dependent oxidoreductase [Candidatus Omnitrophica bacterium]|nr:SDR family NAD(P)-dependent oxidoreductase [Candidatus Omnitrophota bacterium]
MRRFDWKNKKVLVTGGASFIGSHLVDELVKKGANIRVIDNLSSGIKENISQHLNKKTIEFIKGDLLDSRVAKRATKRIDIVFHLANDHGGRGYVDIHQAACSTNLIIDGNVFYQSLKNKVEKIVFASSGCVYPNYLQKDSKKKLYLTENLVNPPYDADNMYGWAKLMGELTLKAYAKEWGVKTASCRFFTVYGPRGKENHAVMAMIARAFIKQDPFEVWGNGEQIRNWTYVSDIVNGMILAAEKIDDGTAVNLGNTERIRVIDAVREVLKYTGHKAKIKLLKNMPSGPNNRVADNQLAKKLLGWEPKVKFIDGLHKTIDWYFKTKEKDKVKRNLHRLLIERK